MTTKDLTYNIALQILTEARDMGNLTPSTFLSLRSTLSRVLRTVYGNDWCTKNLREINAEDLYREYAGRAVGKYSARYMIIVKSRLRRIFKIIAGEGTADMRRRVVKPSDPTNAFIENVDVMQSFLMEQFGRDIFGTLKLSDYNYYILPVATATRKNIGLIVPKDLKVSDFKQAENLFNSILLYEYYKLKGGRAMQNWSQDQNN